MIISGGSRCNGGFFAKHLTNDKDNDRASLCEIRGVTAETVDGALREMAAVASGTRCKNFFYHANINPRDHEHLTAAQWQEAVDQLEKNLGLEGQPRFVMEHEKEGRTHRHVIWSRIDCDTMRAIGDSQTAKIHERTSRELEIRFDLVRGHSVLEPDQQARPERGPQAWENFRGLKSGIDPREMKAELTELWRGSDSGKAFTAAIEERGYVLARGDRRDFVVMDQVGDAHSLARRLEGVKAAEVRAHMADIDRDALPSVAEGKAIQLARQADHQAQKATEPVIEAEQPRAAQPTPAITTQEVAGDYVPVARQPDYQAEKGAEPVAEPVIESELPGAAEPAPPAAAREVADDYMPASGPDPAAAADRGIMVASDTVGKGAEKLSDFVVGLFDSLTAAPPPKKYSALELATDPAARRAQYAREGAERRSDEALRHIREHMEAGRALRPEDVQALTPEHIMNIRAKGDAYLEQMVRMHEKEQAKGLSRDLDRD